MYRPHSDKIINMIIDVCSKVKCVNYGVKPFFTDASLVFRFDPTIVFRTKIIIF